MGRLNDGSQLNDAEMDISSFCRPWLGKRHIGSFVAARNKISLESTHPLHLDHYRLELQLQTQSGANYGELPHS
jgi:hypothetical protein